MTVRRFSSDFLASLIQEAERSPRARQHRNIHTSYEEPCQRLFNAVGIESYIRPHRHSLDPKVETLVAVRGLFALVTFEDDGAIREIICFGTERYAADNERDVGVDVLPGTWHTVIALVPNSVLLEIKAGPFNPDAAKEPAPWAPDEGTLESLAFLENMKSIVNASFA